MAKTEDIASVTANPESLANFSNEQFRRSVTVVVNVCTACGNAIKPTIITALDTEELHTDNEPLSEDDVPVVICNPCFNRL